MQDHFLLSAIHLIDENTRSRKPWDEAFCHSGQHECVIICCIEDQFGPCNGVFEEGVVITEKHHCIPSPRHREVNHRWVGKDWTKSLGLGTGCGEDQDLAVNRLEMVREGNF